MGGFEAVWPWCISQWQPQAEDQMNEKESRSEETMHCGRHGDLNKAKIQTVTEENILTFIKIVLKLWDTVTKIYQIDYPVEDAILSCDRKHF